MLFPLSPGRYTAIVRGANNTTGVGFAEACKLENYRQIVATDTGQTGNGWPVFLLSDQRDELPLVPLLSRQLELLAESNAPFAPHVLPSE